MNKEPQKVAVAMSGGVDSSVAAALLQKEGYETIGVFMKFWKDGKEGVNKCCSSDSERNARLTCQKLGIPFYVFNFEKEFKKEVVDYFLKTTIGGDTPNPCVVCNEKIKFGLFLEKSLKLGADFIATGHYAKKKEFNEKGKIRFSLLKGKDKKKDQSYFLWALGQKELKHMIFPVGIYTKDKVKKMAEDFKLPSSGAKESMEVCFISDTIDAFLERKIGKKEGDIVYNNKAIGKHKGVWLYTLGQRKGIGLSNGPYYVIKKDIKSNILFVGKNKKLLNKSKAVIKKVNWVSGKKPKFPLKVTVMSRYNQKSFVSVVNENSVVFNSQKTSITPGQSMVFYKGQELLGGGIIKN
ncbi:MAG: tRNA 2-thiouridine(34) synthase MnmA [Candidatus Pacebacteria bacterium]|nr:tRNA 2-thiouridine(34) synthase MnmA [Candidatus Paceibacterota bacterium]MDD3072189.1 tRNA 2-thiouridine(34) synthase MnmA [Candidatus Paceibacterota bacterium]MDD4201395.1 tRNA 2-thiouridine(34) synthase MnmA [Candidatus Paceibacterota bacterium]MDD4466835.1 tRNA 2-thiouridine(34) synthase MnmA [Candidatus Paceibacterota bacterium]MDD4897528.1 tRNA 2-thiouridine(34) synthase MnmA [Candidatus Paceibacterota bacterium]